MEDFIKVSNLCGGNVKRARERERKLEQDREREREGKRELARKRELTKKMHMKSHYFCPAEAKVQLINKAQSTQSVEQRRKKECTLQTKDILLE